VQVHVQLRLGEEMKHLPRRLRSHAPPPVCERIPVPRAVVAGTLASFATARGVARLGSPRGEAPSCAYHSRRATSLGGSFTLCRLASVRARFSNSLIIATPAANPPTCAQTATPPLSPISGPNVTTPIASWTKNQ